MTPRAGHARTLLALVQLGRRERWQVLAWPRRAPSPGHTPNSSAGRRQGRPRSAARNRSTIRRARGRRGRGWFSCGKDPIPFPRARWRRHRWCPRGRRGPLPRRCAGRRPPGPGRDVPQLKVSEALLVRPAILHERRGQLQAPLRIQLRDPGELPDARPRSALSDLRARSSLPRPSAGRSGLRRQDFPAQEEGEQRHFNLHGISSSRGAGRDTVSPLGGAALSNGSRLRLLGSGPSRARRAAGGGRRNPVVPGGSIERRSRSLATSRNSCRPCAAGGRRAAPRRFPASPPPSPRPPRPWSAGRNRSASTATAGAAR